MICSPRSMRRAIMREIPDLLAWMAVVRWFNDQPAGSWHSLADMDPHVPIHIDGLLRMLNGWAEEQWVESRVDSCSRSVWRRTTAMPISDSGNSLLSVVAGLPVR